MMAKNNGILIIHHSRGSFQDYNINKIRQYGYKIYHNIIGENIVMRMMRKIHFSLNLPFKQIWYAGWKKIRLDEINIIIVFESFYCHDICDYLRRRTNAKIIVWYYDPIEKTTAPKHFSLNEQQKKYIFYSFDKNDCQKYGMKYNTQFYYLKNITKNNELILYDIVFIGRDKGRLNELLDLEKEFISFGFKTKFIITRNISKKYKNNRNFKNYSKHMSYIEYIELVKKSKAILDIVQKGQDGITIRPFEALAFNKKLITNDNGIKNCSFYSENNIYLINESIKESIKDFMEKPLMTIDEEKYSYYDFDNWILRFN